MASYGMNVPAGATRPPARAVLREHPIKVALFNNTGPITLVWLVIR